MKKLNGLLTLCSIVLTEIVAFILSNIFSIEFSLQVPIGLLILIFLLTITFFTYFLIISNKKLQANKEENINLKLKLSQSDKDNNAGTMQLMMAFTQSQFKSLKINQLEEAYKTHHNLYAGLYLADIYSSGIEYKGKTFIAKDHEKSAEIYEDLLRYDNYGVCNWMLGWYYQNKLIKKAKIDPTHMQKAEEYYQKSMEQGFPKAYNSIGNFIIKKWNGHKDNEVINAISKYKIASDLGDVYATLNCGNYHLFTNYPKNGNIEEIKSAIIYYSMAANKKNEEGYLKLGMCYEEEYVKTKSSAENKELLKKARDCYVKSILSTVIDNQFGASAYYKLGILIIKYPELDLTNDTDTKKVITPFRFENAYIECFVRSYEMFQEVMAMEDSVKATGEFKSYYDNLIEDFKNFAK